MKKIVLIVVFLVSLGVSNTSLANTGDVNLTGNLLTEGNLNITLSGNLLNMKEEKQYLDKKNILDIYVVELAFMVVFGLMYVFYKNFRFI